MRLALPLFALFVAAPATTATLITRQSLPDCAKPCLTNANTGSCAPQDDSCLCADSAFINSTTQCIASSCSGSDLQNAEAFAQQLCLAAGVTLTATPTLTTQPSSAALSSPTASSSSTASSKPSASSSNGASMTSSISLLAGAVAVLAIGAVL